MKIPAPPFEAPNYQKSAMPFGGKPADDDRWLWELGFWTVNRNNDFYDRVASNRWDLPEEPLFRAWQAESALYEALVGWKFPDATGPSHNHRERFLAIQWRLRSREILAWLDEWADARERAYFEEREKL